MKHLLPLIAAVFLLTSSAFADIRSYHGGITIGVGGHSGHHGHHHRYRGHHHRSVGHHHYNHGYPAFGYSSLFHPAYSFHNYDVRTYTPLTRTVVVRERAPKPPRASTFAPSWTPGGGWKTHSWYRGRPQVVTSPDTLRDARTPQQLQEIYGSQASSLAR